MEQMKFTFSVSPNYRSPQSTSSIMKDLTMCLGAVTLFSVIYYCMAYGAAWGLRIIAQMAAAIATSLICDALWYKARKSKDIAAAVRTSYSWVTAMILVLISPVKASIYAVIVCTAVAVIFGKLVFGGFGQNIFNPAAFGEAVLMNNFAATYVEDFTTSATPTVAAKGMNWLVSDPSFYETFGGLGGMFMGRYASTIGSTCALLLILCAIYLIWNKDIDWQVPVTYICTVFVLTLIEALMKGLPASYAVFNVLAGGVMFGAVFMMTDPVTSPVTLPGRVVFAVGAGMLTFIIRLKSNLADGVLYSILLMNMLVPAIDKMFDGNQIKDAQKFAKKTGIAALILLVIGVGIGATAKAKEAEAPAASADGAAAAPIALNGDFADNEATCTDNGDGTYSCSAKGFGLINNMGEEYKNNEATVTVKDGAVVSVEVTTFGDTQGVGDQATTADALKAYEGKTLDDSVDAVSGATFTSNSVASMVSAALNAAAGK